MSTSSNFTSVKLVPFTSGLFAIYAFFWPESFANWFGGIIHIIRAKGGF